MKGKNSCEEKSKLVCEPAVPAADCRRRPVHDDPRQPHRRGRPGGCGRHHGVSAHGREGKGRRLGHVSIFQTAPGLSHKPNTIVCHTGGAFWLRRFVLFGDSFCLKRKELCGKITK